MSVTKTSREDAEKLIRAVYLRNTEELKHLLEIVDVNAKKRGGHNALAAAIFKKNAEYVLLLIEKGADLSTKIVEGCTPLHLAAEGGNLEVIKILLAAGADLEAEDKWGNSPLGRVIESRDSFREVVHLLLDAGADRFHKNHYGHSPFSVSQRSEKLEEVYSSWDALNKNP